MPGYATVTREKAGQQQNEIRPAGPPPGSAEAPKSAAPGSHPLVPVESDQEALADYQGARELAPENEGCWKLNAWNQPVWVPGRGAGSSGGGGGRRAPENRLPEDDLDFLARQRAEAERQPPARAEEKRGR